MKSPADPPATLRLNVDTEGLAANWRALDALSGAAEAGAAVKANCYGLGVDTCVPTLQEAGCRQFFVAHWSEVEAVSRHVPPAQIGVLHGVLNNEEAAYARAIGAIPVINSLSQAKRWLAGGGGSCHAMIDTGISRLGLAKTDLSDESVQALEIDILMSHLACADEDSDMNPRQLDDFVSATTHVPHRRLSLANSAGIALGSDYAFDMTRPGLSLYGGVPRPELASHIRQVGFLEAAIIQCRDLSAGDSVGYNATFTATEPMRIATVSLGYADGYLRSWAGMGSLLHNGVRLPVLGRISMDMVAVDLALAPSLAEGDWLQVPYELPFAAQQSPLTQYELLTVLGPRFGA
ncbi:MAG: alanine racemase [Erythrobacter sp.]|nr:alanine racemase [Erythrobacter sp.]